MGAAAQLQHRLAAARAAFCSVLLGGTEVAAVLVTRHAPPPRQVAPCSSSKWDLTVQPGTLLPSLLEAGASPLLGVKKKKLKKIIIKAVQSPHRGRGVVSPSVLSVLLWGWVGAGSVLDRCPRALGMASTGPNLVPGRCLQLDTELVAAQLGI